MTLTSMHGMRVHDREPIGIQSRDVKEKQTLVIPPHRFNRIARSTTGVRHARTPGMWFASLLFLCAQASAQPADVRTPAELYGPLFEAVQMGGAFPDSKTFVDAIARSEPEAIVAEYERARTAPEFTLRGFIERHFILPQDESEAYRAEPGRPVCAHIDVLWPVLTRRPDEARRGSSLLPLPHRYVVPGGRFREIYYWDSYFTMLGLEESGRHDLARDMVRNFAFLIDRYGHVPNGNRTYYLSRSQPPFFAAMVTLLAERDGDEVYVRYLPQLAREHAFWMDGAAALERGAAYRRVVRLADGTLLNRYWDDRATAREEAWKEDVATARGSSRPAEEVYRNLRAAAESGWDFSSRWLADARTLATIRTVEIVPADLNSLLFHLEMTLSRAYEAAKQPDEAAAMRKHANARRAAIQRYLWNPRVGAFGDYLWREERATGHVTAAALYPLFFNVADDRQARRTARTVGGMLLRADGLATTLVETGHQWDAPNGWPPLQWIAIRGLRNYGHAELAETIARRWIRENVAAYRASGKLVEKYDVTGKGAAGGGEYPLQDGFGWTNGVLRKLLALHPSPADCASGGRK